VEVVVRDGYLRRIVYAVHVGYAVRLSETHRVRSACRLCC